MKKLIIICLLIFSCKTEKTKLKEMKTHDKPVLNLVQANNLAALPIHCIQVEYPNKLGQVLGDNADLQSPKQLHPAFYGCFDWHSSVHGHWSLVKLMKDFPKLDNKSEIEKMLLENISSDNILREVEYFNGNYNKSFERTYGWAWLLKLAEELHTWDTELARTLEQNLKPLTDLIVDKYIEFLPKLNYPIRVGEHTNTAFGLTFAWDYAVTLENFQLQKLIKKRSRDFYLKDGNCPISWEPSGFDFLSPCLQEAAIMKRTMSLAEFRLWFGDFLPQMANRDFDIQVGEVSDRKDGKLVHLDGVNFSRAWCLLNIVEGLPEYNHLKNIAYKHINYSLPNLVKDSYEGGHWLGSFAIYALSAMDND